MTYFELEAIKILYLLLDSNYHHYNTFVKSWYKYSQKYPEYPMQDKQRDFLKSTILELKDDIHNYEYLLSNIQHPDWNLNPYKFSQK